MGNCECNAQRTFYDLNAWQILSTNTHYEVIRSLHDQATTLQKWESPNAENQFEYQCRQENPQPWFPKIYHYGSTASSAINKQYSFIITDVLTKFSTLRNLTNYECLFVLKQLIKGIKILIERHKPFEISEDMIWIDQNGKPMVWISQNLAQNKPAFPVKTRMNNFQEHIIRKLIDIVGRRTETGLVRYFPRQKISSFFRAIQFFEQQLKTSVFPVEKVRIKNMSINKKQPRNLFDEKETSIILQNNTLNHSYSLPKIHMINQQSNLMCNVPMANSINFPSKNSLGLPRVPSATNLTQKSISTKNSEYFSIMAISTNSHHSDENETNNQKQQTRNSFGLILPKIKKPLSNFFQKNTYSYPFQAIQRNSKVSRDPDELLFQLIKSQNIKFQ